MWVHLERSCVAADHLPNRIVAIAAGCRTGSSLLAAALTKTGALGTVKEVMSKDMFRRLLILKRKGRPPLRQLLEARSRLHTVPPSSYTVDEILAVLDQIGRQQTGPQGVLCLKVMWGDYARVLLARGLDLGHWGAPITWLRIRRLDHLRQAVSWSRAIQSDQWTTASSARSAPLFNPQLINHYLNMAKAWDASWDDYFNELGIQPCTIHYEDLSAAYEATIRAVFDHLGLADHAVPTAQLSRQADAINDDWLQRFQNWQASLAQTPEASDDMTQPLR